MNPIKLCQQFAGLDVTILDGKPDNKHLHFFTVQLNDQDEISFALFKSCFNSIKCKHKEIRRLSFDLSRISACFFYVGGE